jgi:hypothetical protein
MARSHKAFMSEVDANFIEAVLEHRTHISDSVNIFEWGSGRSTVYFSAFLAERSAD